jgi:hypothetical protein
MSNALAVTGWSGEAFNQVPDSDNQIHGDDLARQYGFQGGLVPGVTVSAYLTHPAVVAWGEDWLQRGSAHVRVLSPLYDHEQFDVRIASATSDRYRAELYRPDGTLSATAEVGLPIAAEAPPTRRGDPLAGPEDNVPPATAELWTTLQRNGCRALRFDWDGSHAMGTYLRDEDSMPGLLRPGQNGFANTGYLLGLSNWTLMGNAYMNPWVHLETRSQHYRAIPPGTAIITEMTVQDCFERKGHEFVDVLVALFDASDDSCLATIGLRAIYKLRGAGTAATR